MALLRDLIAQVLGDYKSQRVELSRHVVQPRSSPRAGSSARFNRRYIGTEHLLRGLVLESEGVAARVLENKRPSGAGASSSSAKPTWV